MLLKIIYDKVHTAPREKEGAEFTFSKDMLEAGKVYYVYILYTLHTFSRTRTRIFRTPYIIVKYT